MEFTPDTSPPKRTRARSKPPVAGAVETESAAPKKPRAPRKPRTAKPAADPQIVAATLEPTPEDVGTMIATAAYYLAEARNFSPGHELDDWLAAERAIHARLYG